MECFKFLTRKMESDSLNVLRTNVHEWRKASDVDAEALESSWGQMLSPERVTYGDGYLYATGP